MPTNWQVDDVFFAAHQYYLPGQKFSFQQMPFITGLLDAGAITLETLVWAEGVSEGTWVPLHSQTDLYAQVYYISSAGQSIPPATQAANPSGEFLGLSPLHLINKLKGNCVHGKTGNIP